MGAYPLNYTVSNLTPRSYDLDAVAYLKNRAFEIDMTASLLDVSPHAIADSMTSEITQSAGQPPLSRFLHEGTVLNCRKEKVNEYEDKFVICTQQSKTDPAGFDGNSGMYNQYRHPTLSDVAPGSIKILTAIQLIKQFGNTQDGIALRINEHSDHDIRAIVGALEDRTIP